MLKWTTLAYIWYIMYDLDTDIDIDTVIENYIDTHIDIDSNRSR